MADRKPFITLGRSKIGKIFGFLLLIFLIFQVVSKNEMGSQSGGTQKRAASKAFHEVTVPSKWFEDYSQQRMTSLVQEYEASEINKQILNELKKLPVAPDITVNAYQDNVEGEKRPGWVIRFTAATADGTTVSSQDIASKVGQGFAQFMEKYRK